MSATGWCFTSFRSVGWGDLPSRCVYLVYQLEKCPKTDRVHWQGYVEMDAKVRMGTVKQALDDPKIHLEIRRGQPSQASAYCKKDDSRIAGPWEFGSCPNDVGQRHDLIQAAAIVRERGYYALYDEGWADNIIAQFRGGLMELHRLRLRKFAFECRDVSVVCIYGPAGAGKTRLVYDTFGFRNVYNLPKCKDSIPWFENYDGQDVLLIDEMEKNMFNFGWLMQALDRYPIQCPIKGSTAWGAWTKVVICSNHNPSKWFNWEKHCRDALYRRLNYEALKMREDGAVCNELLVSHSGVEGNTKPSTLMSLLLALGRVSV